MKKLNLASYCIFALFIGCNSLTNKPGNAELDASNKKCEDFCPTGGTCCPTPPDWDPASLGPEICVDLAGPDPANCGGCGITCDGVTELCQAQGKTGANPPALCCDATDPNAIVEVCGDKCVNTLTDTNNCGGCDAKCNSGEICSEQNNTNFSRGPWAKCCPTGTKLCGAQCIDNNKQC